MKKSDLKKIIKEVAKETPKTLDLQQIAKKGDILKLISILKNQEKPKREGDWDIYSSNIEIDQSKDGKDFKVNLPKESLSFIFNPETGKLRFISNYKD